MTDDSLDEQSEKIPVGAGSEPATPVLTSPEPPSWTAERVLDITLGLASVTAEAATDAIQKLSVNAKALQDNAPAIRDALEERGRPIREQLASRIRETLPTKSAASDSVSDVGDPPSSAPATGMTASAVPADQEIAALEQRVRELEQQVSQPVAEEPASSLVLVESGETTAEEATFVPDDAAPLALAESEYAVSETETESASEAEESIHMESPDEESPFKDQESAG